MVREPGAKYLIEQCGLYGHLTIDQANYLFNGGSLSESSTNSNMKKIAAMQEMLPLYRLLGGSLRNQVIGGSLNVLRGSLVCCENQDKINKMLPEELQINEPLKSCEEFIGKTQYTRGDAQKRNDADKVLSENEEPADTNLMIYNGQSVVPGTLFYHGFILNGVSKLELGALLHSLQCWSLSPTIGGSARIGHGQLELSVYTENSEDFFGEKVDETDCVLEYVKHVQEYKDDVVAWLDETFPEKKKKVKK